MTGALSVAGIGALTIAGNGAGNITGNGALIIVGIGPGPADWIVPEASAALEEATDLVGYQSYLDRVPERPNQRRHGSDNRFEIDRARHALAMAAEGRRVAVVSGGDPGVFAMAAAVFEAIEAGDAAWRRLDVTVVPGISAMHAAAARLGAPLGQDFCAISLSDNLKSWEVVERRLRAAADGDFVIALFNPASRARPGNIHLAFRLLRACKTATTPVAFARAIGRADERIILTTLGDADPAVADMSTLVLIGSSETRFIPRPGQAAWLLTPRSYGADRNEADRNGAGR
jgi:precorrin-3B C17-methyltransferase